MFADIIKIAIKLDGWLSTEKFLLAAFFILIVVVCVGVVAGEIESVKKSNNQVVGMSLRSELRGP